MKVFIVIPFLFILAILSSANLDANEENEFAEFEDDIIETTTEPSKKVENQEKPPVMQKIKKVEKKEEDFDDDFGIADEEIEDNDHLTKSKDADDNTPPPAEPLKFADVPAHFRSNWASYQVEAIVIAVILIYVLNYLIGRNLNLNIASKVFDNCQPILTEQFAVVSDDGLGEIDTVEPVLRRDTDYSFSSWCSGRINVNSFHITMKTIKRQDLVSRVLDIFTPTNDKMTIKVNLESAHDTDPIILALGEKKAVTKTVKEMLDLSTFTSERKQTAQQFNLPANWTLYSDQNEVAFSILEPGIVQLLKKYENAFELLHVSDQYTGPKPPEGETYTKLPEPQRFLTIVMNLDQCQEKEEVEEMFQLIFYLIEKIRKFKLSKEAKFKAEKRRKEFEEAFLKNTHQFRQEAAQARREEKTRERKQKLLDESDPDRQRRLEAKELKREAKAKQPKMKQLKMK